MFGVEPDDLTTPERSKLILAYPDRVDKYRSYVLEKFKELKLLKALTTLTHMARRKGIWTTAMEKKYYTLDELVTKIMKDGEQRCMIKNHTTPWSMALMEESYKLYYWSLKISGIKRPWRHKEKRVQKATLRAKMQDHLMSLETVIGHRIEAMKEMKVVLQKAKEIWDKWGRRWSRVL